jgi:formylglycine-generating enzyme required for sulfatase activity
MSAPDHNTTDQAIRELLKWRLLEQDADDALSKNLMDMEAIMVFGKEAQAVPSPLKEQELLNKLRNARGGKGWMKWMLGGALVIAALLVFLLTNKYASQTVSEQGTVSNSRSPLHGEKATSAIDTSNKKEQPANNSLILQAPVTSDTSGLAIDNKDTLPKEDPRLVSYRPAPRKITYEDDPDYSNVPVLTVEQIEANNKAKTKMIKRVIKMDKDDWALVPTSTVVYKGDTFSVNGFYMQTTEVTNKQYRIFLNDLLAQGKPEEYLKAVPDTLQWAQFLKYFEPMTNMYFWHPAYDNYPVVNISREGAVMYCNWLTRSVYEKVQQDNPGGIVINDVRLPVDIEWVSAARGDAQDAEYPWGTNEIQNTKGCYLANFNIKKSQGKLKPLRDCDNKYPNAFTSAGTVLGEGWNTSFVNAYNPNKYGLFCMSGNVAEMVWDHKVTSYLDWKKLKAGTMGGSWNSDSDHLKIEAEDEFAGVVTGNPFIGFRPVITFLTKDGKHGEKLNKKDSKMVPR